MLNSNLLLRKLANAYSIKFCHKRASCRTIHDIEYPKRRSMVGTSKLTTWEDIQIYSVKIHEIFCQNMRIEFINLQNTKQKVSPLFQTLVLILIVFEGFFQWKNWLNEKNLLFIKRLNLCKNRIIQNSIP